MSNVMELHLGNAVADVQAVETPIDGPAELSEQAQLVRDEIVKARQSLSVVAHNAFAGVPYADFANGVRAAAHDLDYSHLQMHGVSMGPFRYDIAAVLPHGTLQAAATQILMADAIRDLAGRMGGKVAKAMDCGYIQFAPTRMRLGELAAERKDTYAVVTELAWVGHSGKQVLRVISRGYNIEMTAARDGAFTGRDTMAWRCDLLLEPGLRDPAKIRDSYRAKKIVTDRAKTGLNAATWLDGRSARTDVESDRIDAQLAGMESLLCDMVSQYAIDAMTVKQAKRDVDTPYYAYLQGLQRRADRPVVVVDAVPVPRLAAVWTKSYLPAALDGLSQKMRDNTSVCVPKAEINQHKLGAALNKVNGQAPEVLLFNVAGKPSDAIMPLCAVYKGRRYLISDVQEGETTVRLLTDVCDGAVLPVADILDKDVTEIRVMPFPVRIKKTRPERVRGSVSLIPEYYLREDRSTYELDDADRQSRFAIVPEDSDGVHVYRPTAPQHHARRK